MKLDRNILENNGRGKYALIKLRETHLAKDDSVSFIPKGRSIRARLNDAIDFGDTPETEFFVIRLKDKYAAPALRAYAKAAEADDQEYAIEVLELAITAELHPNKKRPD